MKSYGEEKKIKMILSLFLLIVFGVPLLAAVSGAGMAGRVGARLTGSEERRQAGDDRSARGR
ncbi:MAG TPA: hypothetical protein VGK57_07205 [Candidatus Binatia bacterium]|jgi:hypothetical protein